MKLNDRVYNFFKWLTQIFLPAAGVLYFALSDVWGLPKPLEIVATLAAICTFLGVILGISSATYKRANEANAGYVQQTGVNPDTGLPDLALTLTKMPDELLRKKTITLAVDNPPAVVEPNVEYPEEN